MVPTQQPIRSANPDVIADQVARVRERIAAATAHGARQNVTILAVAKYLEDDGIAMLHGAGIRHFAENRLEPLQRRSEQFGGLDGVHWEFVGQVQSRKARAVAQCATRIHSIASASSARKLAAAAQDGIELPSLLLQVNVDGDPDKAGIPADMADRFLDELPPEISIDGLMTMPALAQRAQDSRETFVATRLLATTLRGAFGDRHPLAELSMGTTQDFDVAVEEGATIVRLGRVLYEAPDAGTAG